MLGVRCAVTRRLTQAVPTWPVGRITGWRGGREGWRAGEHSTFLFLCIKKHLHQHTQKGRAGSCGADGQRPASPRPCGLRAKDTGGQLLKAWEGLGSILSPGASSRASPPGHATQRLMEVGVQKAAPERPGPSHTRPFACGKAGGWMVSRPPGSSDNRVSHYEVRRTEI